MKQELKQEVRSLFESCSFDCLAVGLLDFVAQTVESIEFYQGVESQQRHFYDLASLTKTLTVTLAYLKNPSVFDEKMHLLLNHRAGLPAYGNLRPQTWRDEIMAFPLKESPTHYSDYGPLRLMLEYENKNKHKFALLCQG